MNNLTKWGCVVLCVLMCAACSADEEASPTLQPTESFATQPVGRQSTLQAEVEATAAALDVTPEATIVEAATLPAVQLTGTPIGQRTGECPIPEGYELHIRQGFCVSTPAGWTILNVDGGLAAFLGTTPGQAIGIQPDWAESPAECELTMYITSASSASVHLAARFEEFQNRSTLDELGPESIQSEDGVAVLGFSWQGSDRGGAIYAGDVGTGRIVHISRTGTNCPLEAVLPVIQTFRINPL